MFYATFSMELIWSRLVAYTGTDEVSQLVQVLTIYDTPLTRVLYDYR
jgi:hypothetical protein